MRFVLLVFLVLTLSNSVLADVPFDFSTPEKTWATFKFSLDTNDWELFQRCLHPEERKHMTRSDFEKFLQGDGRFAQTSRVVGSDQSGGTAVLSIDFYCKERDGRLLVDNDPVRLLKVDSKWLIEGI